MAPTQTAEPSTDVVTFQSASHNLRIVRFNESEIPNPLGDRGTPVPGLRYEFTEHRLFVDDKLIERDREILQRRAELRGGEYTGDLDAVRAETLEFLRSHDEHGRLFAEIPLSDMAPPPDDALKAIAKMAATLDRDGLTDLIGMERETFKREVVIDTAEEALATVQPILDAAEQQQAEQASQQPPEPPGA